MLPFFITNPIAILLTFSTATGVLLHDMHIDKAAVTALSLPSSLATYEANNNNKLVSFSTDLHTHTERNSLAQVVHDLKTPSPRLQPRQNDDKKHLLQKYATRGHHAFDNYNLPLV